MKKIILIILLASSTLFGQTRLEKGVLGSGGNTTSNENHIIRSTIGQSVIGITQSPTSRKNLGFWYSVNSNMNDSLSVAVVAIPSVEEEIANNIDIPIILQNSRRFAGQTHKWTATISFNSTILSPIGDMPSCGTDETCKLTVSGEFSDSTGILYNLKFRTKLGSVLNTDIKIESFTWTENISTIKSDGFFQLKGVCEVDGVYRLIYRSVEAGLIKSYPNPAVSDISIDYQLREDGLNKLELVDTKGDIVTTIGNLASESGSYTISTNVADIPSGVYYLVLTTPNEIFTKKIAIEK